MVRSLHDNPTSHRRHSLTTLGDGRADFLCLDLDGRTTAWLNKGPNNFVSQGQVKFSEGADRANIRFADIDGDVTFPFYLFVLYTVLSSDLSN